MVEVIAQGEVADVEEIEGIRVVMDEQNRPMVEYLIKWKVYTVLCLSIDAFYPCICFKSSCTDSHTFIAAGRRA